MTVMYLLITRLALAFKPFSGLGESRGFLYADRHQA